MIMTNFFPCRFRMKILDAPALMPMPQTAQNVVDMYLLSREELDAFTVTKPSKIGRCLRSRDLQG